MKILIVEDQNELREGLVKLLRHSEYVTDTASNGEEGLYKALNWSYDAIVLDWMMPIMSGPEMLKKLRVQKNTPVIMLTAKGDVKDQVTGLNVGADDYLSKPFDVKELLARIRTVIRRSQSNQQHIFEVGNVILDADKRELTIDGKDAQITSKEFALAELLISKKGECVTRDDIYERLFDDSTENASNVVDVYICNLRNKLGKDFIRTKRGYGYIVD